MFVTLKADRTLSIGNDTLPRDALAAALNAAIASDHNKRLFVRAGRLEYGLGVPIVLVRLPPCAGPRGIRAGNKVDRAGGRAYAQPR